MQPLVRRLVWIVVLAPMLARADEPGFDFLSLSPDDWSLHAQATAIGQVRGAIHSPYQGANSLQEKSEIKETVTMTLFLGRRLWKGAEFFICPEVTQGTGLSHTLGIAGFPNGEATRASTIVPEISLSRMFLRQTINLGGEEETLSPDLLQFPGTRSTTHLILTVGKLAAPDIFDGNRYSHDPRTQFFNWALMETGSWDYPADTKGYTSGVVVEFETGPFSLRYGGFMEPDEANGPNLEWNLKESWGHTGEFEWRYSLGSRVGIARFMGYLNRSNAGSYEEALSQPAPPDITLTRKTRYKYGFGLSLDQDLTDDLGAFARVGWNNGSTETWAFTEIDSTAAVGVSLKGALWSRPEDQFGLAVLASGLSRPHRNYLAAGGLGFILGDGALRYGHEEILETYYETKLKWVFVTLDYQFINHPADNRDRGPVSIVGLRVHWQM